MGDHVAQFREYIRLDRKRVGAGLTPGELRRWDKLKRLLNQRFSPGLSLEQADRRDSVRVPTRLAVSFRDLGELRRSLMTNLNRGGVFIETDDPAEIGTRLELKIQIEDTGKDVTVAAQVVSQNVGPGMLSGRTGMGLRFLEMDSETEQQISELYEKNLQRAAEKS